MIKKQHVKSRNVCKVTFTLPADLDGDAVHLHADFNDWEPVPFDKQKNGSWKLVQEVEPGREYEFRYRVVHGDHVHYFNDDEADRTARNEHGSENAVVSC